MVDSLILITILLGVVLALVVGRLCMRMNRRYLAWVFDGGGVFGVVIVGLWMLIHERQAQHEWHLQQSALMVNVTESLVAQAAHQQQERDKRTHAYLREREATVGDVFPLTELKESEVERPGLAWLPEVDEQFSAAIYPSKHTAMRSLLRATFPLFSDVLPEDTTPAVIQMTSGSRVNTADDQRMFDDAVVLLREQFEGARVLFDPSDHRAVVPDPPGVQGGVSLQLTLTSGTVQVSDKSFGDKADLLRTLQATLKGPDGRTAGKSVQVLDKPWVDQFDQYSSRRRSKRFVVARSHTFAATAEAAHQQAMTQAVELLMPGVFQSLDQMARIGGATGVDRDSVEQGLRRRIYQGYLNADRFTQRLEAPYGTLWREAILLELDTASLRSLVNEMAGRSDRIRRGQLSQGIAVCILILVVVVLYLFLNWATKGYYRGTVTLLAGVLCVAGSLFILLALSSGLMV
jgi:hypothetical protein